MSAEVIIPLESAAPIKPVERFAAHQFERWCAACDQFLRWERANVLLADPTAETTSQHRAALSLLLRFLRVLHQEALGVGIDPKAVTGLSLRLRKLEGSWTMLYDSMPPPEAKSIHQQCFPDEHMILQASERTCKLEA